MHVNTYSLALYGDLHESTRITKWMLSVQYAYTCIKIGCGHREGISEDNQCTNNPYTF